MIILTGSTGGIGRELIGHLSKIDDVVGAVPAHLFAGIWGTLAVPITFKSILTVAFSSLFQRHFHILS